MDSSILNVFVANTKGGSGKSSTAQQIIPYLIYLIGDCKLEDVKLDICELEATNKSREPLYTTSIANYYYDKLDNKKKLHELFVDATFEDKKSIIFDIGGGRDSLLAVKSITSVADGLDNFIFIFPFNLSQDSFEGAFEMYSRVIDEVPSAKCLFVVNEITYSYDDGGVPLKEYLTKDDIDEILKDSKIDVEKATKTSVPMTYIPEFVKTLPSELSSIKGCCLDYCKDFIEGKTAVEMLKDVRLVANTIGGKNAKLKYMEESSKVLRMNELYITLQLCKPLFDEVRKIMSEEK